MYGTRPRHIGAVIGHGSGAVARLVAIQPHLRSTLTVLSRRDLADVDLGDASRVPLPYGAEGPATGVVDHRANGRLGLSTTSRLVAWMQQETPDLVVVDGCEDAALVARLSGVTFALVRGYGDPSCQGDDLVHRDAVGLIAPYPAVMEPASTPAAVLSRTVHAGLVSPLAGRKPGRRAARRELGIGDVDRVVTVVCGHRGLAVTPEALVASAAASTGWSWHVVGRTDPLPQPLPPNLHLAGTDADPVPYLRAAEVAVAGAALSTVSDVAALQRPLVVIPRHAPAADETELIRVLGSCGAAVPLFEWPPPEAWPAVLGSAAEMSTEPQAQLCDGRGPQRVADWLDAWAATPPR